MTTITMDDEKIAERAADIPSLGRRTVAEAIGTFWLVLGGCGSAVLAAAFPQLGIGFAGVAMAFGLSVLTMAYVMGPVSGAHFNPAVTIGLWMGNRLPGRAVPAYIAAQVMGAMIGGAVLYAIAHGSATFDPGAGFASNGYGAHSPGHFSLAAAALCELVLTCAFVFVIMGATDGRRVPAAVAPVAIGLTLTLIHLISIPVTNTSVNPARSTGVAVFGPHWAVQQLWLFWVVPLAGGGLGGALYRKLAGAPRAAAAA